MQTMFILNTLGLHSFEYKLH